MEKEKFKVRDIDEWKTAFIKLDKIKAEVERRQFDPIAARRWRPLNTRQRGVSSREIVGRRGREWKRGQGGKAVPPKQREFGPFDARELNLRKEGDVFKMHGFIT